MTYFPTGGGTGGLVAMATSPRITENMRAGEVDIHNYGLTTVGGMVEV
jgi:hypothetical protein